MKGRKALEEHSRKVLDMVQALKEQKIDMMAEQKVALDCIPVEQQGMLEDKDKEDTIGVEVGKLPKWKKKKKSRKKMVAVARNDSIDISADAADAAMLQIIKKEFVNSTGSNVEIKITPDYNLFFLPFTAVLEVVR